MEEDIYMVLLHKYNKIEEYMNVGANDAALQRLNSLLISISKESPNLDIIVADTLKVLTKVGEINLETEPILVADNLNYTDTKEFVDLGRYLRTLLQGGIIGREKIHKKYKMEIRL